MGEYGTGDAQQRQKHESDIVAGNRVQECFICDRTTVLAPDFPVWKWCPVCGAPMITLYPIFSQVRTAIALCR